MKNTIFATSVAALLCVGSTAWAATRVSEGVTGNVSTIVQGSAPPPLVKWTANNGLTMDIAAHETLGWFDIVLPGAAAQGENRMVLMSGTCDGATPGLIFKNETSILDKTAPHRPAYVIETIAEAAGAWLSNASGVSSNGWQGDLWGRTSTGDNGDAIKVEISSANEHKGAYPGVYTATYCIQQTIG
ncbi:hypothetical protein GL409_04750 [Salmonella enterica]|nr:hypothetical protein [Salmonella enterica]